MKVKVEYLGEVKVIVSKKEEEWGISPETTVKELMRELSNTYGDRFDKEVFQDDGETPRDDLIIAINGTAIRRLDFMQTKLKQGDIVTLFPIFPGGG